MKSLIKSMIAVLTATVAIQAQAGETPVFVSCYADSGSQLTLIFDTAQSQFTYRYARGNAIDTFEVAPSSFGASATSVTKQIAGDQNHFVLKAHIVSGDPIQPIFTDVRVQFDRTDAGLQLTKDSFYHADQIISLAEFKAGICYVQ